MRRLTLGTSNSFSWKLIYAAREQASVLGEAIAHDAGFVQPPIDPFRILNQERKLIHADGYDFGDCFDGRIKYVGPRFLIAYNTKYNRWPHRGQHHSKILFTIGHELGHYFLPKHRDYLVKSKKPHGSLTEFTADPQIEQEADCFASGLLMPGYLFRPRINSENFPSLANVKNVRSDFQVSLTGMLVRWTLCSDFPCMTIAIQRGEVKYGWVSEKLRDLGIYRPKSGRVLAGKDFQRFLKQAEKTFRYVDATGSGAIRNWADYEECRLLTQEHYFLIPHSDMVWAFITADENELPEKPWED